MRRQAENRQTTDRSRPSSRRHGDLGDERIVELVPADPRFEDGFMMLLRPKMQTSLQQLDLLSASPDLPVSLSPSLPVSESPPSAGRSGSRSGPPLRQLYRRRPRQLRGCQRRNFWTARTQWRGQDHDLSHALRSLAGKRAAALRVAGVGFAPRRAPRRASRSAMWRKNFHSTASSRSAKIWNFLPALIDLRGERKQRAHRLGAATIRVSTPLTDLPSGNLPGGFKQRLAMAAALLHEPETLVSRRADQRRRSFGAARVLAAHHRACRAGRDRDRHDSFHGRSGILRPHRDSGRRPGTRPGYAGGNSRARARPTAREPTMEDAFIAIVEAGARKTRRRHAARQSAGELTA